MRVLPACRLYKLALSTMSLEISKMSFQILRPSENRWYAEFVRNTSNRLRPGPRRVWADKVGRPGIPKAQWRTLTKKSPACDAQQRLPDPPENSGRRYHPEGVQPVSRHRSLRWLEILSVVIVRLRARGLLGDRARGLLGDG